MEEVEGLWKVDVWGLGRRGFVCWFCYFLRVLFCLGKSLLKIEFL